MNTPKKKIKVVCTGMDLSNARIFNIVKIGVYDKTVDGCLKALKDGIFDKFKREAPRFSVDEFKESRTFVEDGKEITECRFILKEYDDEDSELFTKLAGQVVFTEILPKPE